MTSSPGSPSNRTGDSSVCRSVSYVTPEGKDVREGAGGVAVLSFGIVEGAGGGYRPISSLSPFGGGREDPKEI